METTMKTLTGQVVALERLDGLQRLVDIAFEQSLSTDAAAWASEELAKVFDEVRAYRLFREREDEPRGPTVVHVHVPPARRKY